MKTLAMLWFLFMALVICGPFFVLWAIAELVQIVALNMLFLITALFAWLFGATK